MYEDRRNERCLAELNWIDLLVTFEGLYTMTWGCVITRTLSLVENIADLDSGHGPGGAEVACLVILRSEGLRGCSTILRI